MKSFFENTITLLIYVVIVCLGFYFANWLMKRSFWIDFFSKANPDNAGILVLIGPIFSYLITFGILVPIVIAIVNFIFDKFWHTKKECEKI